MIRNLRVLAAVALGLTVGGESLQAQGTTSPSGQPWMSIPDILPPGGLLAVVSGNPAAPGHSVIQIYMPDGYRLPPHHHPMDEHVEVVSGALLIGIGPKVDRNRSQRIVAGDSGTAPPGAVHWSIASGPTVLQVSFEGPYRLTYIHAYEAPRSTGFPPRP